MERVIQQREKDLAGMTRIGRKYTEQSSRRNTTHRGVPCPCAVKAASFVAMGTNSLTQDILPGSTLAKPNIKTGENLRTQERWGHGVGWVRDFCVLLLRNIGYKTDVGVLPGILALHK